MSRRLKIDPAIVAPWETGALEAFNETWEHVLSSTLMYSVRIGRRGFKETEKIFKQAPTALKKFETETLTIEAVIDLVADWCGVPARSNKEEGIMAWAADQATPNILAADRFAKALFVSLSSRPQMALPI
jgi:hypothetical protein